MCMEKGWFSTSSSCSSSTSSCLGMTNQLLGCLGSPTVASSESPRCDCGGRRIPTLLSLPPPASSGFSWHSVVDGHSPQYYFLVLCFYPVGLRLCVEPLLKSFQKDSSMETLNWDSFMTSLESWLEHLNMGLNLTELYNYGYNYYHHCYYYHIYTAISLIFNVYLCLSLLIMFPFIFYYDFIFKYKCSLIWKPKKVTIKCYHQQMLEIKKRAPLWNWASWRTLLCPERDTSASWDSAGHEADRTQ